MREIKSHTSLRGIAAILVTYYHLDLGVSETIKSRNVTMFIENSFALVDLFFVLSGFILTYVYWDRFSITIDKKDCVNFFISRFSRVYPLHVATLIFMVLLFLYSYNLSNLLDLGNEIVKNIFLVHAWGLSETFIFNFPSWSVSVEFFAYLTFPAVIILMRNVLGNLLLFLFVFIAYAFMFFELKTFHAGEEFSLVRGVPSFILGIYVCRLKWMTSRIKEHLITAIQVGCLALIVLIMHYDLGVFFLLALFPILVLTLWEDRGFVAKTLCNKYFVYLGTLSYSIYLLHIPIKSSMSFVFPKLKLNLQGAQEDVVFTLTVVILTVFCSMFTYHFFEKPSRDTLRRILSKLLLGKRKLV